MFPSPRVSKMRLCLPVIVIVVLCTICNVPANAYPSNGETESEASGGGEEDTRSINEILEGEANTDSDNDEYDIVHKVVIETTDDDDDDGENVEDDDEDDDEDNDDDNVEDNEDDNDDDDEEKIVTAPYKKYKKWLGWRKHPLYVVILGGFRWDFLDIHKDKDTFGSFKYLKEHGSVIPHVKPVFPPEDYPVWTSIATGLYPEDHDITGDVMYDLKSQNFFKKGDFTKTRVASWWESVNPFWSIAAGAGRKVAFFNWHDCRIPGAMLENPNDCLPYPSIGPSNSSMHNSYDDSSPLPFIPSHTSIAQQADAAFTKIHKDKYDISIIYTDIIRRNAEQFGPESRETFEALKDVDDILQAKLTDLGSKKDAYDLSINLLVISDYGLSDSPVLKDVNIEEYLDEDDYQYLIYTSGYATIIPYALKHDQILMALKDVPGLDAYITRQVQDPPLWHGVPIPEDFKFGDGMYAQDILIVAKPAFQLITNQSNDRILNVNGFPNDILNKGAAGRNPYLKEVEMPRIKKGQTLTPEEMVAHLQQKQDHFDYHQFKYDMDTRAYMMGPDFKENYELENEIEVVDFYQLICFLLQIPAQDHDGSWDRIEDILTISGSPSFLAFTITPLFTLCISLIVMQIY